MSENAVKNVSFLAAAVCLLVTSVIAEARSPQPNVVFILADDLGWADTTLYGHTKLYQTPNIERLARRGMTFNRAYSASPLCSPTRASILTGLSPARIGITSPACHLKNEVLQATPGASAPPNYKATIPNTANRLKTDYYTLSRALKDVGYTTGHFGKWHLGHEPYSPLEHGFDVDIPHWPGPGPAGSFVAPWKFPDFDPATPNEHIEDRMADEAVAFLEKHKGEPFLLNYWMFSVHAPFDAKRSLIEKHRRRIDPDDAQRSPTYAAMVESMDDAVGTLLDTIDRLKLAERTIIVFFSDNGGNMYNEVDGATPTSNRPLRGGKATMFEGGVRVPCVVIWPGVVEGAARSDQIIESSDFYPTLLEMLGVEPRSDQQFDGISIVPALKGESLDRDAIFTYFPHNPKVPDWLPPSVAVIQDEWKLIRIFYGGENDQHRWKLFNLRDDIGESKNLAADEPDRVQQMDAMIEEFLIDTKAVLPRPNPDFDPSQYRPEDEGKPGIRQRKAPRSTAAPGGPLPKPVAGWQPSRQCRLKMAAGSLNVTSTGGDPYLSFALPKPLPAGSFEVLLSMTSTADGRGQFFWTEQGIAPPFFRDRSVVFEMKHDGESRDYHLKFTTKKPVTAVRLDPGQAAGEVTISALKLTRGTGELLHEWKFGR